MARTFNWLTGVLFRCSRHGPFRPAPAPHNQFTSSRPAALTAAFTEHKQASLAPPGSVTPPVFGPSGLLRQQIENGARLRTFWPRPT